MRSIAIARSDEEIARCYAVMSQLRPHLDASEFVALVRHLGEVARLELAYLQDDGDIKAVAGIRMSEWLAGGKYLEIEDLVTAEAARSKGYGSELFDWVVDFAQQHECRQVRLVSRVTRTDAHRFYERKGMRREAYYFSLDVAARGLS